jgi:hypothetical protein
MHLLPCFILPLITKITLSRSVLCNFFLLTISIKIYYLNCKEVYVFKVVFRINLVMSNYIKF